MNKILSIPLNSDFRPQVSHDRSSSTNAKHFLEESISPSLKNMNKWVEEMSVISPMLLKKVSPSSLKGSIKKQSKIQILDNFPSRNDSPIVGKKSGKWTSEEDTLLQQIAPIYGERHWRKVSQHMKGRSAIQCLHRWTKILKPGLVKGPWTTEEDGKLLYWVEEKGPSKWAQCAQFIPGRSGKQCRERWFNNLNPNVKKGDWASEEDDKIFKLYLEFGSSWSKIASHFADRTENSIKNRFYSTIRKLYSDQKKSEKKNGKENKKSVKKEEKKSKNKESDTNNFEDNKQEKNEQKEEIQFSSQTYKKLHCQSSEINTLYNLLKTSNVEHAPHIYNIYSSGIYKKTRKSRRKQKKTQIMTAPLDSMASTKISKETLLLSDTSSECNFESLLSSIENCLNKDTFNKEMDSLKDMSLEELQNKVIAYCQEENEPKNDKTRNMELEEMLNQQIEKEILNYGKAKNESAENIEKMLNNEILANCGNDDNFESDKKMFMLVQQLQTLENILTSTRQELMNLENSLQIKIDGHENNFKNDENTFINENFNLGNCFQEGE